MFVCAHAPGNGEREKDRRVFWENLNDCLSGFEARVNLCLLGNLNTRVSMDREVSMAKRLIAIGSTLNDKKLKHKLILVSGVTCEEGLLNYICISNRKRDRLLDVEVFSGVARGISDDYLVIAKIRMEGEGLEKVLGVRREVMIVRVEKLEEKRVGGVI